MVLLKDQTHEIDAIAFSTVLTRTDRGDALEVRAGGRAVFAKQSHPPKLGRVEKRR